MLFVLICVWRYIFILIIIELNNLKFHSKIKWILYIFSNSNDNNYECLIIFISIKYGKVTLNFILFALPLEFYYHTYRILNVT